ncbi:MAG: sigma-70 family RNA polymerase sigma factor [Candidatus Pseudomonas colombiensis]|jgi:RNA polymerase sigma factor (sigma-70 family)|uniref:Sigma-70 family RNA polymerase sigma factor n=1 Tax=Pseudomonas morbosilactucae TaxID=2938197 RepID=A0ABT0JI48_9PSED|nr:sigma-70 family RNA polymerase sigma factor [Pseudomonas morbosilactucae]MCK9815530.1 sigma-70 family RNA polymerase sigma factor [Pseudomonas morbosilactucae]WEK08286.1 MAG: sigma-70 family RNA polymerase sigma factor [Pseudomonas sp.]
MDWNGINLRWAYTDLLLSLSRRTQCVQRAYDVLHDAFIRFLLASQRTPIEQPNAYLRRVAHSVLIDHFREAARYYPMPEEQGEPWMDRQENADFAPSAEHLADLQQRLQALQRILDCLPPRCREVFWLARIEGHRQPEIARMLGISLSMVERHLMRALLDLRQAREVLAP